MEHSKPWSDQVDRYTLDTWTAALSQVRKQPTFVTDCRDIQLGSSETGWCCIPLSMAYWLRLKGRPLVFRTLRIRIGPTVSLLALLYVPLPVRRGGEISGIVVGRAPTSRMRWIGLSVLPCVIRKRGKQREKGGWGTSTADRLSVRATCVCLMRARGRRSSVAAEEPSARHVTSRRQGCEMSLKGVETWREEGVAKI